MGDSRGEEDSSSRVERYLGLGLLAGITLLAAGLRFFRLGQKPFWLGEIQEIVAARSDRFLAQLVDSGTDAVGFFWHHLVYSWGLEPLEFHHRLLAAITGVLTIPVVYRLGQRLGSRAAGVAGAAVLAVSFFHIYHSQDARAVSYLTFFFALSWLAMIEVFLHQNRVWALAFVPAAALTGLSHAVGGVYLVIQGAFFVGLAFWPGWRVGQAVAVDGKTTAEELVKRYMFPALLALPLCALQFYVIADYGYAFTVTRHPVGMEAEFQDFFLLKLFWAELAGGKVLFRTVISALFVVGIVDLWRKGMWRALLVLTWLLGPSIMLYVIMTFGGVARFEMYHLLPCLVPFALGVGAGAAALPGLLDRVLSLGKRSAGRSRSATRTIVIATVVALGAQAAADAGQISRYFARDTRLYYGEDLPAVADYFAENPLAEGDVVFMNYGEHLVPLNFYAANQLRGAALVVPWIPEEPNWRHHLLVWAYFQTIDSDIERLRPDEFMTVERFLSRPGPVTGRVYCLLYWLPSFEQKGYGDYYRWITGDELYERKPFVDKASLPEGFELFQAAGVDMLILEPEAPIDRFLVADTLVPLLIQNAPPLLRDMAPRIYGAPMK